MTHHSAAVCTSLGGPNSLALKQVEDEGLAPGHVRIDVSAAGVNYPDYLLTRGEYQLKLAPPFIPGMEIAGIVTETADDETATQWPSGTKVIASTRIGGFSEQVVVSNQNVFALPTGYSAAEGATFMVAARTAHHALVGRAGLLAGEVLVVLGATGGVGMAAVQIGNLLGATVIAIGSDDAKLQVVQAAGAHHVVNYRGDDLVATVRDLVGSADVIFDAVGGDLANTAVRLLGWRSRYLTVGFASGTIPNFEANRFLLKEATLLGVRAGEAARQDPTHAARSIDDLFALAEAGDLRPHISHRFALTEAAAALNILADRRVIGRVALILKDEA